MTLYLCNFRNPDCHREKTPYCVVNGGECKHTSDPRYAKHKDLTKVDLEVDSHFVKETVDWATYYIEKED